VAQDHVAKKAECDISCYECAKRLPSGAAGHQAVEMAPIYIRDSTGNAARWYRVADNWIGQGILM
jgi:hypothetical protein